MPFPKDWRRYNPNMIIAINGWENNLRSPLIAKFDTAQEGQATRQRFYAFINALERGRKNDPVAERLWEIARCMTFRLATPEGKPVNFVKGYTGPVVMTICEASHDRYGDSVDQLLFQNKLATSPEELMDTSRPSYQALLKLADEQDKEQARIAEEKAQGKRFIQGKEVVEPIRAVPPLATIELKRQPDPPNLMPAPPVHTGGPRENLWKDTAWTKADLLEQAKQVFSPKMLGTVLAKDPSAAEKIARKQLLAFAPDGVSNFSPDANEKICKDTFEWLVGNGWAVE